MALAFTPVKDRSTDRRRAPRQRTLLAARFSYGEPAQTAACGVRNLSPAGALVELEGHVLLVPPFRLLLARTGTVYDATLVWRHGLRLGVAFTGAHDLTQPVDRQVQMLQAIWREMALR